MLDRMLSYAQHGEDVIIARVFGDRPDGYYVDVGAAHPEVHSVTKHFYDRGWYGLDVEPIAETAALLRETRPRDTVLEVAIGAEEGELVMHVFPSVPGLTTLDQDIAARHERERGLVADRRVVRVARLETLLREHSPADEPIAFLKIDAEGFEETVLRSFDLIEWRPRVLVVEATEPGTDVESHMSWESIVERSGYRLAQFDGLNRFYAHADDAVALERMAPPVTDDEYIHAEVSRGKSRPL